MYKGSTPRSDPVKGGLLNGNIVEVDLEKNSQSAQPILTSHVGTAGNYMFVPYSLPKTWRDINHQQFSRKFRHLLTVCLAKGRNDV